MQLTIKSGDCVAALSLSVIDVLTALLTSFALTAILVDAVENIVELRFLTFLEMRRPCSWSLRWV